MRSALLFFVCLCILFLNSVFAVNPGFNPYTHHYSSDNINRGNETGNENSQYPLIDMDDPAAFYCLANMMPANVNLCLTHVANGPFIEGKSPFSTWGPIFLPPYGDFNESSYKTPLNAIYGGGWYEMYHNYLELDADDQLEYPPNSTVEKAMATSILAGLKNHQNFINDSDIASLVHMGPYGLYWPLGWSGLLGTYGYAGFAGERVKTSYFVNCGDYYNGNDIITSYDLAYLDQKVVNNEKPWLGIAPYTDVGLVELYIEEVNDNFCNYDAKDKVLDTSVVIIGQLLDPIEQVVEFEDTYTVFADQNQIIGVQVTNNNGNFVAIPSPQDFNIEILNDSNEVVASATDFIGSGPAFIQFAVPGEQLEGVEFKVRVSANRVNKFKAGYILSIIGLPPQDSQVHPNIGGNYITSNTASW